MKVIDVCRIHGIGTQTYYTWKSKVRLEKVLILIRRLSCTLTRSNVVKSLRVFNNL